MKYIDNDLRIPFKEIWTIMLLAVCIIVIAMSVKKNVISVEAGIVLISICTILTIVRQAYYNFFFKKIGKEEIRDISVEFEASELIKGEVYLKLLGVKVGDNESIQASIRERLEKELSKSILKRFKEHNIKLIKTKTNDTT